jgi:AcrR family transcriptional regulator
MAERSLRANARQNRTRILEVAFGAFASEGLGVPVQEIARRAGVGTGSVSRLFPTRESLFQAVLLRRAEWLLAEAARLEADDPAEAFFSFFALVIAEGAGDRGMVDAVAGAGFDLESAVKRSGREVLAALGRLLASAQHLGTVRADAEPADITALIKGCLSREPPERTALERLIGIVASGLRDA